jgi:hypothetical protein
MSKKYKLRTVRPLEERFWGKIIKTENGQCWKWSGSTNVWGYGRIGCGRRGRAKHIPAHRLSWQIHYGVIPKGLKVCHHCDNPPCCNPAHLFLGTQGDNVRDCRRKGRGRSGSPKGELNPKAKLTAEQIKSIRAEYATQKTFQYLIAKKYGVTQANINDIVLGKTWRHI